MSNIINFTAKQEKQKDELVPIEEWDGECWKTMFNTLAEMIPEQDPWEVFANFIKETLVNK
jgi:hypothetical protein